MFRGINAVAIDDKGRLAIPARYRDLIGDEAGGLLVITIDTEERCLLLYPYPQWEQIERKLEALPSYHPASRRIQRLLRFMDHLQRSSANVSNRHAQPRSRIGEPARNRQKLSFLPL